MKYLALGLWVLDCVFAGLFYKEMIFNEGGTLAFLFGTFFLVYALLMRRQFESLSKAKK